MIGADPNCPGMGGDAFLSAFLAENPQTQQTLQYAPLAAPTNSYSVSESDVAPIPSLTPEELGGPTYETSAQTGSMILGPASLGAMLLPVPVPAAAAPPLLTGEELTSQLLQRTFVPSGSVLAESAGPSLFEELIAGKTFTPAGLSSEVLGGPLSLASIPLGAVEAAATPASLAQAGVAPPVDLAGTLDIASLFPALQPQPLLDTQPGGVPPPEIPPVETLTNLPEPTPNIGDVVVSAQPKPQLQPLPLALYDPTGYVGGLPGAVLPAPSPARQPSPLASPATSPGPARAPAPVVAQNPSPQPLPQPAPAPAGKPATSAAPGLSSDLVPQSSPNSQLLTQPQPQAQKCEPKKQTKKRKPRTVCHRGTYVEHKSGLSKSPKETIECQ